MKNYWKTAIAATLATTMLVPTLVSCGSEEGTETTTTEATTTEFIETVPEITAPTTAEMIAARDANVYANAGHELVLQIIEDCYITRTHVLRSDYANNRSGQSFLWAFSSFLEAVADAYALYPEDETIKQVYVDALTNGADKYKIENAALTTPNGRVKGITYYNANPGTSGDYYYDDNAWLCYQFLYAYEQLGDQEYLDRAEELLTFFWTGWDDKLGGGIYWDKDYASKNTCENGPIAICYLWAYQFTQNEDYLNKAKAIYDWTRSTLLDGSLYCDSINVSNQSKNTWKADYNQGTMLYAASMLYEITGETTYRNQAKSLASASLSLAYNVTESGDKVRVSINNNPIYKSWCVGWLIRGFMKFVDVMETEGNYMIYTEMVMDTTLATKGRHGEGYYDPYFGTSGWGNESLTDVLQASGVASSFLLCAYYDIFIQPYLE